MRILPCVRTPQFAFVVGYFVDHKIKSRDMIDIFIESAITTTMVSAIIAVAGGSGWLLAYLQFNESAVEFVTSVSQSPTIVLLVMAIKRSCPARSSIRWPLFSCSRRLRYERWRLYRPLSFSSAVLE